jgi:peptidylprolyl isomerase
MRNLLCFTCLLLPAIGSTEQSTNSQNTKEITMQQPTMIELPSGISYQILKPAASDALAPVKGNTVSVHYTGWLNDNGKEGKQFDSSVSRGTPFTFTVGIGQVIKGWDIGVLQMKEGEKIRLFIPADLAYGVRGAPGAIPPNANLIFDVELIKVKK